MHFPESDFAIHIYASFKIAFPDRYKNRQPTRSNRDHQEQTFSEYLGNPKTVGPNTAQHGIRDELL